MWGVMGEQASAAVIPAQAGIHPVAVAWIPTCAGMTAAA